MVRKFKSFIKDCCGYRLFERFYDKNRQIGGFKHTDTHHLSNQQYHIAIMFCQAQLGLLSKDDMVRLTHQLMNWGYYDDLMLQLIDEDLDYPKYSIEQFNHLLLTIAKRLNFPQLTHGDAVLLNTFDKLKPFLVKPPHIYFLTEVNFLSHHFGVNFSDDDFAISADFIPEIYTLDYDTDLLYMEKAEHITKITSQIYDDFIQTCQSWLDIHHDQVAQILTPFAQLSAQP